MAATLAERSARFRARLRDGRVSLRVAPKEAPLLELLEATGLLRGDDSQNAVEAAVELVLDRTSIAVSRGYQVVLVPVREKSAVVEMLVDANFLDAGNRDDPGELGRALGRWAEREAEKFSQRRYVRD